MRNLILILILTLTTLWSQQRSIIFNTNNPSYTCNIEGGTYSNYTCDNECDQLSEDYCTILLDGFTIRKSLINVL